MYDSAVATVTEQLLRNLYPCEVTLGGELLTSSARVFVTNRRVEVWTCPDKEPVLSTEVTTDDPPLGQFQGTVFVGSLTLETSGGTINLNRARGCGCHSPLFSLTTTIPW